MNHTIKQQPTKCRLISVDAIKDFMAYKNVKVTLPNGEDLIINRRDIKDFFNVFNTKIEAKVTWKHLHYGYPGAMIRAIYK